MVQDWTTTVTTRWAQRGKYYCGYYNGDFLFRIKRCSPWWRFWRKYYELAYVPNKEARYTSPNVCWLMQRADERLNWALKIEAEQEKLGDHETPSHQTTPPVDHRTEVEA